MADQPAPQPGAPDEDKELARNRTTFLLMVGGAISLLVPLVAVGYLHFRDLRAMAPATTGASAVFEQRGGDPASAALTPAATPAPDGPGGSRLAQVPNMPPRDNSPAPVQPNMGSQQGGSLSFIKTGSDFQQQQAQQAPPQQAPQQPASQQAPQQQAAEPAPQAQASVGSLKAKQPAKPAYKPFNMPHLQGSRFGGGSGGQQGQGMPGGGNPAQAMAAMQQMGGGQGGAGGMPNMGAMMQQMQNMPGGAGGMAGAGGAGQGGAGMPNMGQMMQQMQNMPGAGGQGGQGGMPNMGAMMQQMQQQQQQGQQH